MAALALVACGSGGGQPTAATTATSLPTAEFPDPGVVHVHGVGVDPADGALYAATHSGLFLLPEQGPARRIANRYQDTMGFTIAGPGRFLGSGHPDPREDDVRPPLLGLVESTDRGQTWQRRSLHGKADFQTLQAAHGRVWGYDSTSQTLMVADDVERDQKWERLAEIPLGTFAVDPSSPSRLLATTEQGLALSRDGGRTFSPIDGAPPLVVLAWRDSLLVGATADGRVHVSSDTGASWGARGSAGGAPEAVALDVRAGRSDLIVATDRGIVLSRDMGRTFSTRYATQTS